MKSDFWRRGLFGILLIVGGLVLLAQQVFHIDFGAMFGVALFGLGGAAFLAVLAGNPRGNWWAAIPGVVLLDLAALILMGELAPAFAESFGGPIFLAGIGLAFLVVLALTPTSWWAVIPAGALFTLAVVAALGDTNGFLSGAVFFFGLGLTFAVLAMLPAGRAMRWPWIPAGILMVLGALVAIGASSVISYAWPVALILAGLFLFWQAMRR